MDANSPEIERKDMETFMAAIEKYQNEIDLDMEAREVKIFLLFLLFIYFLIVILMFFFVYVPLSIGSEISCSGPGESN